MHPPIVTPLASGRGRLRAGEAFSAAFRVAGKSIVLSSAMRLLMVVGLALALATPSEAQNRRPRGPRWSAQPDSFATQVTEMMRLTKSQPCVDAADQFGALWGNLSGSQQKSVMAAAAEYDRRQYRAQPYYLAMMMLVVQASQTLGSDQTKMDGLLTCLEKTSTLEPAKNLLNFCERTRFFLVNQGLYNNKFYTLHTSEAPYTFEYIAPVNQDEDLTASLEPVAAPVPEPEPVPAPNNFDGWGSPGSEEPVLNEPNPLSMSEASVQGPDVVLPALEGAVIRFEKVDLTFGTGYDSTTLYGTKGAFMVSKNEWVGEGGKFDWTVAGLDAAEAYVELDKYSFPVHLPNLLAENATLHYDSKLNDPVLGVFEFRSVKHSSPETSQYPRFMSYNAVSAYKGLGDDVTLVGGFSLQGREINTSAVYLGKSQITIRHNNQEIYRGAARRFNLGDTAISGGAVYSVLPRGLDSLTQTNARLVYERQPEKRIRLYKNKGDWKEAPFFDSYYRVEITCEAMFYTPDSNKIDFINQSNKLRAPLVVESMDYFTPYRYADVGGLVGFNPVGVLVANYNRTQQNPKFYTADVAEAYKIPVKKMHEACLSLSSQGFIQYDRVKQEGVLDNKLKHYYSSMKGMKDYDFIAIQSLAPDRMNARMDLDSNILFVYGVDKFSVNDSLGVYIKPQNRTLKLKQNRDFEFNGEITAGNFIVNGEKFNFNYDFYQVDLQKIDSIDVLPDTKLRGKARKQSATRLTGKDHNAPEGETPNFTSAVLFINKPDNKNNRVKLPQYPIFDVQSPAYVYFDKPNILRGSYDKKVYFYVPPFKVDSISGSALAAISFNGTFHSDGIFPEFEEKLIVRQDKTLGFEHHVPEEGYNLYKGPGKFNGTITLDGKGLVGAGAIKYLTTTVKSDSITYYQDSVIARGKSVVMEKGTFGDSAAYPDATVTDYEMKWKTKSDTMYLTNVGERPWYFYSRRVRMNGTLAINEKGAFGSGLIKASGSRAESPAYSFKQDRIIGRNAFFEVQSANPVKPAFSSKNVRFDFYVDDEYAEFQPEEEGQAANEFPYARYKTSIPKAVWDLKKKTVTMTKPEDADISTSYFYSTLPEQDSLNFQGTGAVYDIAANKLDISGVPFIYVADGMVIPDSGHVQILENAEMTPLTKAVLVLDTINKYHRLVDANITIKGRYSFEGEATYQYINAVNDTLPIRFDKFEFIEEKKAKNGEGPILHTKSGGEIDEEKPLKIANGVLFKGTATMWAERPALEFNGFVKLDLRKTDTEWLKYESTGESKEFVLDLKSATDADGNPVQTGLFMESGELYGVFVNGKRTSDDHEIFSATGVMNFNSETMDFRVGSPDRLAEKTTEGNIFTYNDSTGRTSFEGKLNLLNKNEKEFAINASGLGQGLMDSAQFDINTVLELEMALPSKAWTEMAKVVNARAKDLGLPEAMGDKSLFAQRVTDILGKKAGDAYKANQNKPVHEAVSKFSKGLTFTDLEFRYDKKQGAFYSKSKLNLLNILNTNVNAQLDGYIEIKKQDGIDIINVYIEASPDSWWYFTYDDQKRLGVVSSVEPFNDAVQEKSKGSKGGFYTEVTDETEKNTFLKHFRQDYLGEKINEADYKVTEKEEVGEPSEGDEPDAKVGEASSEDEEYMSDEEKAAAAKKKKKESKKKKKKADEDGENNPDGEPASADEAEEGFGEPAPKPAKKKEPEKKEEAPAESEEGFGAPEPKKVEPKAEEPAAEEGFGGVGEPVKEEPKTEEPKPAAPATEEPKADDAQPKSDPQEAGFGSEEPAVDEPKSEEPKPKKKDKNDEKPADKQPNKEEPPAEDSDGGF